MVPAAASEADADGNRRPVIVRRGRIGVARCIAIGRWRRRGINASSEHGEYSGDSAPTNKLAHLSTSSGSRMVTLVIRLRRAAHPQR
jgi:hypothetical protein